MSMFNGFILGFGISTTLFIGYGAYQLIKFRKLKNSVLSKIKEAQKSDSNSLDPDKRASIKERLIQAAKLAEQQLELRAQAEMPSKNSLHSRYKNTIISKIQDLELEKISILKTILGDGFDPNIVIVREGGVREEISLSQYLVEAEGALPPEDKSENISNGPRKVGKFLVYTGGNSSDDEGLVH